MLQTISVLTVDLGFISIVTMMQFRTTTARLIHMFSIHRYCEYLKSFVVAVFSGGFP